jgi:hypothetical protein
MDKFTLLDLLAQVKYKLEHGEISEDQYNRFMDKARDQFLTEGVEECVWQRPRRPITKPRNHSRGAWRKDLTA